MCDRAKIVVIVQYPIDEPWRRPILHMPSTTSRQSNFDLAIYLDQRGAHCLQVQPHVRSRVLRRHRLLIGQGARMHTTSVERGDGCSIAILDPHGKVVAWHDTLPGAKTFDLGVTGIHVSQFFLPHDVAFGRPDRGLMAACLHGSNIQQRWQRRPDGSILWAYTVIEAMRLGNGELDGYSHVTRFAQDPHARALADAQRVPRQRSVCYADTTQLSAGRHARL